MKKILFSLFIILILVGCQNPTIEKPDAPVVEAPADPVAETVDPVIIEPAITEPIPAVPVVETPVIPVVEVVEPVVIPPVVVVIPEPEPVKGLFVYNSAWERQPGIEALYAARSIAREIGTMTLEEYVEKKNKETADSQLFVFDHEVKIKEAPEATAYIVEPVGYVPIRIYTNVPRSDFIERRETWKAQTYADGGVLFIDQIPPAPPVVIDTRTPYEKYALYIINADGTIYAEEHCNETWEACGYPSVDNYFEKRREMFVSATYGIPGSRVESGKIYTPPVIE